MEINNYLRLVENPNFSVNKYGRLQLTFSLRVNIFNSNSIS